MADDSEFFYEVLGTIPKIQIQQIQERTRKEDGENTGNGLGFRPLSLASIVETTEEIFGSERGPSALAHSGQSKLEFCYCVSF